MLPVPLGKSHNTCSATVGQTPVKLWMCPASLNFSSVEVAAADCKNLPKRVPVLAKPQEGSSMLKESSALWMASVCLVVVIASTRFPNAVPHDIIGRASACQRLSILGPGIPHCKTTKPLCLRHLANFVLCFDRLERALCFGLQNNEDYAKIAWWTIRTASCTSSSRLYLPRNCWAASTVPVTVCPSAT